MPSDLHSEHHSANMHFVSDSATEASGLTARRQETHRTISRKARTLAFECGLDGFTMEHLAEASGVSRRTLFNYFPGKYDALLGGSIEVDPMTTATFRAGGPTGDLIEDLLVVAEHALLERDEPVDDTMMGRRVLAEFPALAQHAMAQLDRVLAEFAEHIIAREGETVSAPAAHALLTTLVALMHLSMNEVIESGGSTQPAKQLRQHVAELRHLLT